MDEQKFFQWIVRIAAEATTAHEQDRIPRIRLQVTERSIRSWLNSYSRETAAGLRPPSETFVDWVTGEIQDELDAIKNEAQEATA